MIVPLGRTLSRIAARAVPDPFVLALFLTLVVMVCGWIALGTTEVGAALMKADPAGSSAPWMILSGWYQGFINPGGLAFALQMCLVLITGHALALTPAVQRFIAAVSRIPRSAGGATLVVAAVACVAGVINWGLGAIAGALVAREVGRAAKARGMKVHYPLLGAAAYSGLAVWHGGFSGSAPLGVAQTAHKFAFDVIGTVGVSRTLGSPLNLIITGSLLILIPVLYRLLTPRDEADMVAAPAGVLDPPTPPVAVESAEPEGRVLRMIQEGPVVGRAVGVLGLLGVSTLLAQASYAAGDFKLDLNYVNAIFLFLGLALQPRIRAYIDAVGDGAKGAAGIILQFPFYYAILGVMSASGLIVLISTWFAQIASPGTFPVLTFLSAGLVNMFVPSGGGQWAVQADVLLRAGHDLGVDPAVTIMAFSYGDAWTNMLQPFWALPLLGIMGLRAKDIIGYTAVICIVMGIVVSVWLLILPAVMAP
ncbi:MAG: short-chain fatty acid transporter [Planctomycetota bacterium]